MRRQVLFPTKYATMRLTLIGSKSSVFQMCLPGLEKGFELLILSWRPCLLSSCLGSDARPMCPCEAQQTPPISPSRTETAGAYQQLDLMRFHHQQVRQTSEGSHLEEYNCLSALAFASTFIWAYIMCDWPNINPIMTFWPALVNKWQEKYT